MRIFENFRAQIFHKNIIRGYIRCFFLLVNYAIALFETWPTAAAVCGRF